MKKILISIFVLLLSSLTPLEASRVKFVTAPESTLLKINSDMKSLRGESDLVLSFYFDQETNLDFKVFSKFFQGDNGKIYLLGSGQYNIKVICIDPIEGSICIPVSKTRKLFIQDKHLTSTIVSLTDQTPLIIY